jgi:hypothetical protein
MQGMPVRFESVAILCLATAALIFVATSSYLGNSSPVDLSQHLMSQFSRYGNEMKAQDDIYTTEGESKSTSYHAWTGDDSDTFDQLKDASSRSIYFFA